MKRIARGLISAAVLVLAVSGVIAQSKVDEQRMERDIEVAENVLETIIKQQFEKRAFFPMEIQGNYMAGYGVTFRIPYEILGSSWFFGQPPEAPGVNFMDGGNGSFSFSFDSDDMDAPELMDEIERQEFSEAEEDEERAESKANAQQKRANEDIKRSQTRVRVMNGVATTEDVTGTEYKNKTKSKSKASSKNDRDSVRNAYTNKIIEASKNFLADYGDLITQLPASEKITITNRGEGERIWYGAFVNSASNPSYISLEALKGDIIQYRQGKLTHDQLFAKIKVINSVMDDELQPDLELLSSIISRLYRNDLSTTYFTQENIYYERLKNFGVIYYMQVYSSNTGSRGNYSMPTLRLDNVDAETRDKKVKELYPVFEKELKENILDYGRTLKSLSNEEVLMFNVKLTRCTDCGIPSSLEVSVKSSVLMDINSGKLTKEAALTKIMVKKGPNQ
jgi:hypothetical protein